MLVEFDNPTPISAIENYFRTCSTTERYLTDEASLWSTQYKSLAAVEQFCATHFLLRTIETQPYSNCISMEYHPKHNKKSMLNALDDWRLRCVRPRSGTLGTCYRRYFAATRSLNFDDLEYVLWLLLRGWFPRSNGDAAA